jgi:hypothetical protein
MSGVFLFDGTENKQHRAHFCFHAHNCLLVMCVDLFLLLQLLVFEPLDFLGASPL